MKKHYKTYQRKMTKRQKRKWSQIAVITVFMLGIGIIGLASLKNDVVAEFPRINRIYKLPQAEKRELTIPEQIRQIAEKRNFKKIDKLLAVIKCESRYDPYAYNVNPDGSVDRGIAQWNDYYHSRMTNEQAFNINYAINKMIDYWETGKENLWACSKIVQL